VSVSIRQCSVAELEAAPNFAALLDEYAQESAIDGLPPPKAKIETYRALNKAGALTVIAAFYDFDYVAGFITVLVHDLLKYSEQGATCEAFFVAKDKRKTGAGFKLKAEARQFARDKGVAGLFYSAKPGSSLDLMLSMTHECEHTNNVYFEALR
jgi:GNAT superfamily N-acetyltransferase